MKHFHWIGWAVAAQAVATELRTRQTFENPLSRRLKCSFNETPPRTKDLSILPVP